MTGLAGPSGPPGTSAHPPDAQLPALVCQAPAGAAQRTVFETLGTARAMRYLSPEPVPGDHIEALVWAATRASSADNTQPWQYIAVTDPAQRQAIAASVRPFRAVVDDLPEPADPAGRRTRHGANHLIENLADVPLLLFVCGANDYPAVRPQERYLWSAVFAAAQNVVVAARALGLGAVFSMLHVAAPGQVRAILGVPAEIRIAVMLAIGWPLRPFGPVTRKPLAEVLRYDHW
jgi:nitroreductase